MIDAQAMIEALKAATPEQLQEVARLLFVPLACVEYEYRGVPGLPDGVPVPVVMTDDELVVLVERLTNSWANEP